MAEKVRYIDGDNPAERAKARDAALLAMVGDNDLSRVEAGQGARRRLIIEDTA